MKRDNPIDSNIAEKLATANVANIAKKLRDGKTLTSQEQKTLDKYRGESGKGRKQTNEWPVFPNHGSAAAAGLAPMAVLKAAAAEGCPAWRSSRWYSGEFLAWYWRNQVSAGEVLNLEQEQAKVARERALKLARERAVDELDLIPRETIQAIAAPLGAQLRAAVLDMPEHLGPRVNPEHPDVAMAALREWVDQFLRVNHELFVKAWEKETMREVKTEPAAEPEDPE